MNMKHRKRRKRHKRRAESNDAELPKIYGDDRVEFAVWFADERKGDSRASQWLRKKTR
jgi:hypothetical protein